MSFSYIPEHGGPSRAAGLSELFPPVHDRLASVPFPSLATFDAELHPDQRHYENMTNGDVRLLRKYGLDPARRLADAALQLLYELDSLSRKEQQERWSELPTHCFFGKWTAARFRRIRRRFERVTHLLYNPALRFFKNPKLHDMGMATPAVRRIHLPKSYFSKQWYVDGNTKIELASTIVHESSHIIGVSTPMWVEAKHHSRKLVVDRAQANPLTAEMLANAYEYFAVDAYFKRFWKPATKHKCTLAMTAPPDSLAKW